MLGSEISIACSEAQRGDSSGCPQLTSDMGVILSRGVGLAFCYDMGVPLRKSSGAIYTRLCKKATVF